MPQHLASKEDLLYAVGEVKAALYRQLWLMGVGTMIAILNTMFLSCRIHLLIYLTTY